MVTDAASAHRFFSADCFNKAWELLDKADLSAGEQATLLHLCHASMWHWTQRADVTPRSLSIGCWQLSRAYAVIGDGVNAMRFAEQCLSHSRDEPPFYLAYAHEAAARAAKQLCDSARFRTNIAEARRLASEVTDPDERGVLEKDLQSLCGEPI